MIAVRPRAGGFAWLVLHELRLGWRARARGLSGLVGGSILLGYVCVGAIVAVNLVDWQVAWSPAIGTALLLATIALLTLMTAQAMLASQRTLYEVRDMDLLLTSPMPERRVLSAKLVGIAAGIVLTYALLMLPMLVPFALLGHPQLLGAVGVLVATAMAASSIGLALTLALTRLFGPRASRTIEQILAGLMGGGFYLATQLSRLSSSKSAYAGLYGWARDHRLGVVGPSGWPGHAAFGDVAALLGILAAAMLLFVAAGILLQTMFLSSYQDAAMRLNRPRPSRNGALRAFPATLRRAVFAKEWRLLARDPALAFQIVLRLVYLLPILMIGLRHGSGPALAPTLAFASVLIASQLAGSLAWLTVSAEDAPELLVTAPVTKAVIDRAKLSAALAMTAPLAVIAPLAMLALSPLGAAVTLVMTAIATWCCGSLELRMGKPGKRAKFAQRSKGSLGAAILGLLVAFVFGGAAAVATWTVG